MGYVVDRPEIEGVGEKPTTPRPVASYVYRSFSGQKLIMTNPAAKPDDSQPTKKGA
jgi:hypothetical protein